MNSFKGLVERRDGLISNEIFSAEFHARELERVFARCWLFLGHESMIPQRHDYFTCLMGDSSVIVQRDAKGAVRAWLNKCRHRGSEVCVYETGNAVSFTCAYHGWTYADGKLAAVPGLRDAYHGELDPSRWGLIEVPKVASFGGLIFGCWDAGAMSLEDYLGDAKWYLENFLLREDMGGLEIVPGAQKYLMPTNWKLLAENFAGDDYHFPNTHSSLLQVLAQSQDQRMANQPGHGDNQGRHEFTIAANYGRGAAHGFMNLKIGQSFLDHDRRQAAGLGSEAVEWLEERRRRDEARLARYKAKPYGFQVGNIFPNLALIGMGTAFYGKGLILHHPTAHDRTEVWMWCAVDKNAPASVKRQQQFVLMQRQAAAGMVAPDDHEVFQRQAANLRSALARRYDFHYGMALGHDADDPRPPELRAEPSWPGRIVAEISEVNQRDFYRYWAELMDAETA